MFLKCNKIVNNAMVVFSVPFLKAFHKGRDTSQSSRIYPSILLKPPSRGQTPVATKPTPEGRVALPCVGVGCLREGEGEGLTTYTSGDETHCQAQSRAWAVHQHETRTLLEIRKGRKVICVQSEFPTPGFQSAPQASSQKLHLLICSWSAAQAAPEGCRHPPPPPFAAGYQSHVYYRPWLAGEDARHPFPCASYSARSCTLPIPTTPCRLQIPFTHLCLPCFTHRLVPSPPSLPTYPTAFLTSALTPLSPQLLASNLIYSSTSGRSGGQRATGRQAGHATTARRNTGEARDKEDEATRVGSIWVKRRL